MNKSQVTVLSVLTAGVACIVGYAIFFDYKRRNDPDFRKNLRRSQKKQLKMQKAEKEAGLAAQVQALDEAYRVAKNTPLPTAVEEKEICFMQEIAKGESLYLRGESEYIDSAICFFRALQIYPNPSELLVIYEKTIPKEISVLIHKLMEKEQKESELEA